MTLLLSCLTQKFAVQASDRKLTFRDGTAKEDAYNKATLLCNQASFAMTGLGFVSSSERTHDFLRSFLAQHGQSDLQYMLNELCASSTERFRRLRLAADRSTWMQHKRTSFVGIGFAGGSHPTETAGFEPSHDGLFPFFAIASNAQSGVNEGWDIEASDRFKFSHKYLAANAPFGLHVAGQALERGERNVLARELRKCARQHSHPFGIARHLTKTVQAVARRNRFVGGNVMCTIVYRSRAESTDVQFRGPAWPAVSPDGFNGEEFFKQPVNLDPMWIYCPESYDDQVHYAPNFACGGLEITGMMLAPSAAIGEAESALRQGRMLGF